jgi:amidase
MARDVQGLVEGMELLEPGFRVAASPPHRVGRLRIDCDQVIKAALDRTLRATGWEVVDLDLPEWNDATAAAVTLVVSEAWTGNQQLVDRYPDKIGRDVLERIRTGRDITEKTLASARAIREQWRLRLDEVFRQVELVLTPTLTILPPLVEEGTQLLSARCTLPANLAGIPALALPAPTDGPLPASVQLMAPAGGEELLLAAGAAFEAAAATT